MAAAFPFVAPAQGPGVLQPFPNPNLYLGAFSNTNPSASVNGQWWYRIDTNTIYQYVNGQVVPVASLGPYVAVYSSETIGGSNVVVDSDVVVLPSATLVTYGSVAFLRDVKVLPGAAWVSSNPNASSATPAANSYTLYGTLYLLGSYSTAPYNNDTLATSGVFSLLTSATIYIGGALNMSGTLSGTVTVTSPPGASGTLSGTVYSANGRLYLGNVNVSGSSMIGCGNNGYLYSLSGATITVLSSATLMLGCSGYGFSPYSTLVIDGLLYAGDAFFYFLQTSDTFSYSGGMLGASPPPSVTGSGLGIFWTAPGGCCYSWNNSATFASVTLSPNTTYASVSAPGSGSCCFGLRITSFTVLSPGWYYLEVYTSNTYYQYDFMIYAGSASLSWSGNIAKGNYNSLSTGYYAYVRSGTNSSGTIIVSGVIYA